MKTSPDPMIKFPCDCISAAPVCQEPWARVAKEGMFKDGTKEDILNRLHRRPQTIAQLAKSSKLARPTVFRHINELAENGLVKEFDPNEKDYAVERYYKPNFPIISHHDQRMFSSNIADLASEIAVKMKQELAKLRSKYSGSDASREGWTFEEFAQFLIHAAQRSARRQLEKKKIIATVLREAQLEFVFWGTE